MTSDKKKSLRRTIQYFVLFLVALVLLYFAFREVKWSDFVTGLKSCNFWWIALSMATSILAFIVRALRWRLIMLPLNPDIKRREAYDGVTIGYLTNFAFPRAGELARCGVIAKTGKASFESVVGSVVLERGVDLISLIIVVLTIIVFKWSMFGEFLINNLWEPASSSFSVGILFFSIFAAIIIAIVLIYVYRKKLSEKRFFRKITEIVKGLWSGLVSGFKMKSRGLFLFYTVALWGCYWFMSMTTIFAFPVGDNLNGMDALFLMTVGSLGWLVPVQGGIGAYHFILSLALYSLYGIEQSQGIVFATISHESQALTMLLCGILSLISISFFSTKKKSRESISKSHKS